MKACAQRQLCEALQFGKNAARVRLNEHSEPVRVEISSSDMELMELRKQLRELRSAAASDVARRQQLQGELEARLAIADAQNERLHELLLAEQKRSAGLADLQHSLTWCSESGHVSNTGVWTPESDLPSTPSDPLPTAPLNSAVFLDSAAGRGLRSAFRQAKAAEKRGEWRKALEHHQGGAQTLMTFLTQNPAHRMCLQPHLELLLNKSAFAARERLVAWQEDTAERRLGAKSGEDVGGDGATCFAEALFAKAARVERDDPRQALDMLHEGIRCTLAALEARSGSADDTTADRLNRTLQRLFSRAFELREKLSGLEHD